jgi:hypothetical protein
MKHGISYGFLMMVFCLTGMTSSWGQVELANSEAEFSGVQGQDGWSWGYRNFTLDGGATDYDANAHFIEFPVDGTTTRNSGNFWDGNSYDWADDSGTPNPPWTTLGATAVHPNGTNNVEEHWAIRRWTASKEEITSPTVVAVEFFVAAQNPNGNGTTAQLHLNGVMVEKVSIQGSDTVGKTTTTILSIESGDILDLALTPEGPSGDRADGADGSHTKMVISTVVDADADGILDNWEQNYFPGDLTQLSADGDLDSDGLTDLQEFEAGTDPTLADPDGDGYSDGEEIAGGSDPNLNSSMPLGALMADSRSQFSGVDGQDGWSWGYRNFSLDGGETDYDANKDFIAFPTDGTTTRSSANFWDGASYDWADDSGNINPPWTALGKETTHPNGTNNGEEHWTVRRWTASGLGTTTPVRIVWHARKGNGNNDGVTGAVHVNGEQVDSATIAGNDTVGVIRYHYVNLSDGDIVDLVLTPQGVTNRTDGSDGSANWMSLDQKVPAIPIHSNGKYFIPINAEDSDADGLADFWEEQYFPGDLTQLASGSDADSDGLDDRAEQEAGTQPNQPDSDGDGLSDGQEIALGTNPCELDSDGDGFSDAQEIATGYDPADPSSNVSQSTQLVAELARDFPTGLGEPQGANGWSYGYYNITMNGEPTDSSSFIAFPTDGSALYSATNFWDGNNFDMIDGAGEATNPPWTYLSATTAHPNGDNNGEVHWTTARWTAQEDGPLALSYGLRKQGIGGNGTTAIVLQNGRPLDELTIGGTDGAGARQWYFVNARVGDTLELALSPKGLDDSNADGNDSTNLSFWIDSLIPDSAFQPDGSPFVVGATGGGFRILSVELDPITRILTVSFTSRLGFEYQVEKLSGTDPVTWTPIGPSAEPQPEGETKIIIPGVSDSRAIIRVSELNP